MALVRDGLQVTAAFPQRTALEVRGTAGTVQRVFGARMLDYAGTGGERFHAPSGRLTIPANLRAAVSAVAGLNSGDQEIADDVPGIGLTSSVARTAYDVNPLYGVDDKAQNERIALVALANYKQSDLDAFDRQFGLPAQTPVVVPVDGGSAMTTQAARARPSSTWRSCTRSRRKPSCSSTTRPRPTSQARTRSPT